MNWLEQLKLLSLMNKRGNGSSSTLVKMRNGLPHNSRKGSSHDQIFKSLLRSSLKRENRNISKKVEDKTRIFGTKTYPELFKLILE